MVCPSALVRLEPSACFDPSFAAYAVIVTSSPEALRESEDILIEAVSPESGGARKFEGPIHYFAFRIRGIDVEPTMRIYYLHPR